jgi:hypothetical protein
MRLKKHRKEQRDSAKNVAQYKCNQVGTMQQGKHDKLAFLSCKISIRKPRITAEYNKE